MLSCIGGFFVKDYLAYKNFSWRFASTYLKATNQNTCISPAGVYLLLSMVAAGAVGETRQELDALLSGDTLENAMDLAKNIEECYAIMNRTTISFPKDLTVKSEYALKLSTGFSNMNIQPSEANDWLSAQNLINFKARWKTLFAETEKVFYMDVADGAVQERQIPFIWQNFQSLSYKETEEYISVSVPFATECHMVLAMPKARELSDCVRDPSFLENALNLSPVPEHELQPVHLSMPRFGLKNHLKDLKPTLQSMGVSQIFDRERSQITEMMDKRGYIETIVQDAEVAVDAKGAYALALTTAVMGVSGMGCQGERMKSISFDRPFMFAIWQSEPTPVPLFIGAIQAP